MTPFVADNSFDACAFLKAAERFVRSKGRFDEDLPSTMLLQALEIRERAPGTTLSLEFVWRQAYEALHPRGSDGQGGRARRDAMDHQVDDVQTMPDGEQVRTTECTVIDFGAHYTPIAHTQSMKGAAKRATGDLCRARYLARLPFGHLPFIL